MKANVYECMAEGVQGAEVIVCFLTAKYQASTNCQQELQFARDSKVSIVLCRVQSSWKPSDWLGSSSILSIQQSLHMDRELSRVRIRVVEFIHFQFLCKDNESSSDSQDI
ncbi:unnamed protein product, partial [Rotaria socialis]